MVSDLSAIPTEELKGDLAETVADIKLCERALALAITKYSGGTTEMRLRANQEVEKIIAEELRRRG